MPPSILEFDLRRRLDWHIGAIAPAEVLEVAHG